MHLLLMRHAEAAPGEGLPDHDRPLTELGEQDARTMGRWLQAQGAVPDVIWCSSALRARQTWAAAAVAMTGPPEPAHLRSVYQAGPRDVIALLRQAPAGTARPLLIGHNPTMQHVLAGITGKAQGFAAGAVAVIDVPAWTEPGGWRLLQYATPKTVGGSKEPVRD